MLRYILRAALYISAIYPLISFSQTSNPIRVGSSALGDIYAYPEDLQVTENGFSVKLISNFKQPQMHNNGQLVYSWEMYYSAVCHPRLGRLNRIVPLTGPMGTGSVLSAAQPTGVWESMKPGDVLDTLAGQLCK